MEWWSWFLQFQAIFLLYFAFAAYDAWPSWWMHEKTWLGYPGHVFVRWVMQVTIDISRFFILPWVAHVKKHGHWESAPTHFTHQLIENHAVDWRVQRCHNFPTPNVSDLGESVLPWQPGKHCFRFLLLYALWSLCYFQATKIMRVIYIYILSAHTEGLGVL